MIADCTFPAPHRTPLTPRTSTTIDGRDYAVFGGRLRAAIEFPELAPAPCARPDWSFFVERSSPPEASLQPIGERRVGAESYRLSRNASVLRLEYSHAGTFDVSADGTTITWYYRDGAPLELVRNIVLGPALALALELAGLLCLHASAVAIGERVVAFVGPKHHGKSTLATALTATGARLVSDDLLAISPGPPAIVRPGIASVRLWADTLHALRVNDLCDEVIPGVKATATGFSDRAPFVNQAVLSTVYVLEPISPNDARPSGRDRLPPVAAAIALAHQTKLPASLVGLSGAGAQLAAAAALAAAVPVYTLRVVRDFAVLPALVERLRHWHEEASA